MAIYGSIAAFVVALAYTAIARSARTCPVESYVVLGGGVLFLGFAAFQGTKRLRRESHRLHLGIGIKIFLLYPIVGLLEVRWFRAKYPPVQS